MAPATDWSPREVSPFDRGDGSAFLWHAKLAPVGASTSVEIDGMDLAVLERERLKRNEVDPAPERRTRTSWTAFLKTHRAVITATDFFSVEVLTAGGPIRHFVLSVIDLKTRRIEIAGFVRQPDGDWMKQVALVPEQ